MSIRLDFAKAAPNVAKAMLGMEKCVREGGLEPALLELVRLRASQINGCAYCLDMHSKDARAAGESEQRLYLLPAWRETTLYSERERAALEWTEAVTLIAADHVPDDVYDRVYAQFSDAEMVNLTLAIVTINGWNRLAISFRAEAGAYQPSTRH